MPIPSAIQASDLRKTYPPGVTALDGLSLAVPPGTIFGLLGPNGAGKSTTVRVLATLTRPDSGAAYVAGIDVLADPRGARHAIGVVGQKHGSDPQATGRENLVLHGECYGMTGRRLHARADELLDRFGLTGAARRQVKTYSGGMQRRLDVAMGLLHRPQVLFLDEPTTGLDPEARAEMWQEIERLAGDEAMTILLTTHYLEEADRLASRLAIVDHGRVVVEGTPEELKSELRGDTIQITLAAPGGAAGLAGLDGAPAGAFAGAPDGALAGAPDGALAGAPDGALAGAPDGAPDGGVDGGVDGASAGRARVALERLGGVREVRLDGRTLRARVDDGAAAIPAVLAALDAQGAKAASVTLARPSLDEVYLRHTGRAFDALQTDDEQLEVAA